MLIEPAKPPLIFRACVLPLKVSSFLVGIEAVEKDPELKSGPLVGTISPASSYFDGIT